VRDAPSNDSSADLTRAFSRDASREITNLRGARMVRRGVLARATHAASDPRTESIFRKAVAHEMLLARESARDRTFDPTDARWRVAEETQRAMQGAVLAFEDRRRILALANKLGIRAFDANLIVALVQDRARRGESMASVAPTLALLPRAHAVTAAADGCVSSDLEISPERPRVAKEDHSLWTLAVAIAIVADAVLFGWLMFG
jgi:hypothetical protein